MSLTGDVIKQQIQSADNIDDFCEKLAQAIVNNLEVKIPGGQVIVQVTGQAAGIANTSAIECEIS